MRVDSYYVERLITDELEFPKEFDEHMVIIEFEMGCSGFRLSLLWLESLEVYSFWLCYSSCQRLYLDHIWCKCYCLINRNLLNKTVVALETIVDLFFCFKKGDFHFRVRRCKTCFAYFTHLSQKSSVHILCTFSSRCVGQNSEIVCRA